MVVVLVVAAGAAWESAALALLGERAGIVVLKRCVDVDDLLAAASAGQAHVAVLGIDAPGLDQAAVEHLRAYAVRPVAIVPGGAALDAAALRATRIGIRAMVAEDDLASLPDAVAAGEEPPDTVVRPAEPDEEATVSPTVAGRVIAVWGPAGAPGRTTVATGLAAELARRRLRTVLVDADPYGGAVAQQLGILDEVSGLLSAARRGGWRDARGAVRLGAALGRATPDGRDRPAPRRPVGGDPQRRRRAPARGCARARPGGRRHRLQPRAGRHARVRLPAGPQPDDPGRARGGRRHRRGRQRRPGRAVPPGPGAGRAARPDRRRPGARGGEPDAAHARLVREGHRGHGRGVHPAQPACTSCPRTEPASTRRSWPAAPLVEVGDSALASALARVVDELAPDTGTAPDRGRLRRPRVRRA